MSPKVRVVLVSITAFAFLTLSSLAGYKMWKNYSKKNSKILGSQTTNSEQQKQINDLAMQTLGYHRLTANEFAVTLHKGDKKTKEPILASYRLSTGQEYSMNVTQDTSMEIVEGSDTNNVYIPQGTSTIIHTYDELDNRTGKIDEGIKRSLSQNEIVPVIVQMNLPFGKYYDPSDSAGRRQDKKNQFTETKDKISASMGGKGKIKQNLEIINGFSADVDSESLGRLEQNDKVKKVELDRPVKAFLDTSVDEINARSTWQLTDGNYLLTGAGKRIAIIDTGVDYTHPDLGGCLGTNCKVIGGYDCVNSDNDPMDDHGHGTHVAATAAGKGTASNGQQLWGVAPDAKILAYKVLSAGGSGSSTQVLCGMNRSVDPNGDGNPSDHVDVASMSLGGIGNPDDSMSLAADNGAAAGVVFTIAAGNSGPTASTVASPGTSRTAITVAAACKTSQIGSSCSTPIASFSSRGPLLWNGLDLHKPDIAAPGYSICAAEWDSAWSANRCFDTAHIRISGTSMATPHVAGAVALIRQAYPDYTPAQVKELLKRTAANLNTKFGTTYSLTANDQGAGEVDLKAAIPFSTTISSTPSVWNITTDPSQKNQSSSMGFSVTPKTTETNTLSISSSIQIPGMNITFSKTTLQVSGKTTDNFTATISVDNDTVKSGTYYGSILFSESGEIKGSIPINLIISSDFAMQPSVTTDYGVDDPSLSVWSSTNQTVTVSNLRKDIGQTVTVSTSSLPSGVSLQNNPSSLTIPAGGTATFTSQMIVDNTKVANGIYEGVLILSSGSNSISKTIKFTKYYVLTIQDSNITNLSKATGYLLGENVLVKLPTGAPKTVFLNNPGKYGAVIAYPSSVYNTNPAIYNGYLDFKENINVTSGVTMVNSSMSDVKNTVSLTPTDISGGKPNLTNETGVLRYKPTDRNIMGWWSVGTIDTSRSYSNTTDFMLQRKFMIRDLPKSNMQFFDIVIDNLTSSLTVTNKPSDLQPFLLQYNTDTPIAISPYVHECFYDGLYNTVCTAFVSSTEFLPTSYVTLYTIPKSNDRNSFFATYQGPGGFGTEGTEVTPSFTTDSLLLRWIKSRGWSENGVPVNPEAVVIPSMTERAIYSGLGPSFFAAKFQNAPTTIQLAAQFSAQAAFLRQDYAIKDYGNINATFTKPNGTGGTYVNTSTLAGAYGFFTSYFSSFYSKSTNAGLNKVEFNFPYPDNGATMSGKVVAQFDTTKADPNPPAFKRLYYYSNGARSEVYDPAVANRLDFELNPIGGTMGTVTVSYSASGGAMSPATVALTNGVYTASIPSVSGLTKMAIQITGTDSSSNSLTYTFELPVGTAPPAPSGAPTPTPTVKPGDANGDNLVNEIDYTVWLSHYGQVVSGVTNGDFNGDGKVDGIDYTIWLNNYGK